MKKKIRISIIFGVIGLIAGILAGTYQLTILDGEIIETIINDLGNKNILILIVAIQAMFLSFTLSLVGQILLEKTTLKFNLKLNKKDVIISVLSGLFVALVLAISDFTIFNSYIPSELLVYKFSFNYFFMSILYGGIIEEVFMRLFFMTLIVFIVNKIVKKEKQFAYVIAIIVSSVLFALGHLPATKLLLGWTTPLIIRALLLNSIAASIFGYLYWKKGLAYSIIAHIFTHIFTQLILFPILF